MSADRSLHALREALLGPDQVGSDPAPPAGTLHPADVAPRRAFNRMFEATPGAAVSPLPSALEVFASSPGIPRLCESYHRTRQQMVSRSRRQKLGIALLVAGIGVGTLVLDRNGSTAPTTLTRLVLAAAVASCTALGVLALLWFRDEQRLRRTQGERLLRALQIHCDLPRERLKTFLAARSPVDAFFDCYALWRKEHPGRAGGLTTFVQGLSARRAG